VRDARLPRPDSRFDVVAVSVCLVALVLATPVGAVDPREPVGWEPPLLVGALVHHREVGSFDVLVEDDGYLIPLDPFAQMARCTVEPIGDSARLTTPLGTVYLQASDLREVEGILYLRESAIEGKLATPVAFDSARFALNFDLPWRSAAGPVPTALQEAPQPDVTPPDLSLSTLQSDIRYTRAAEDARYGSSTTVGGRMFDGYWRVRYQDDFAGNSHVRDYSWFHARDNLLFLAGHQNIRLHPLLQSVELTGLQIAATNHAPNRLSRSATPGALLSRSFDPLTTFRGPAPPAGVAELRVNGSVVERQIIGLDGVYEFTEVSLPVRHASRIEVRVFDRRNLDVPVAIYEEERNASAYLLEDGALVHMGGLGRTGNPFDQYSAENAGYAGFYQTRYGASDRLTLEAALQWTDDALQAFSGMVARLGQPFVLAVGFAGSDGAGGYRLDLDGHYPSWRLVARSQATEAGFAPYDQESSYDHMLEVGYERRGRWDAALVGKSWKYNGDSVDFILPAFAWRPTPPLGLRARPDHYGDYRFDLSYRMRPRTRLTVSTIDDRGFVDLTHAVGASYQLALESDFGDDLPDRQAAIVSWRGASMWRPGWTAGVLRTDGEPGYLLGGFMVVVPGISARLQYESDAALEQLDSTSDRRLNFNLSADLGFTRGRVHAARAISIRDDRGGFAGVVRVDAPRGFRRPALAGVTIIVDGQAATRTEGDGSFFVGGLRPGVYRIELDNQFLPIELTPTRSVVVAEIAPAAVTRVDFAVRPEFGIAGRVTDARRAPLLGARLELFDADGTRVHTTLTDRFGLYRMDGLPIGRYVLRLSPEEFEGAPAPLPEREIEIRDDFLFEQDLELPFAVEVPPRPTEISLRGGETPSADRESTRISG
jgi:hypothetical protein